MNGISRLSVENAGCPARRSCPLIFPSISPGSVNGGSSTSIKKSGAGSVSHSSTNAFTDTVVPRSSHSSMHCRSSHIPFTFFRKQMDLPAPPRLVKFMPLASSLTQGVFSTVPTSDQVPELMRSEEHTSELQSRSDLVCRLLLEKKKKNNVESA